MVLLDTQLTAGEVLRAFHRDEPFLFLGSAFTTVGIVSAAFCLLRRRFDALLISMAVFALLYGQRLWFQSALLGMVLPNSELFVRLRSVVNYLVPVPAFFFFQSAGLLGRAGKWITWMLAAAFTLLALATSVFGGLTAFQAINNVIVIGGLVYMMVASLWRSSGGTDSVILRVGLACFVALALWDNALAVLARTARVEPYGFAVLLGSLGYVAARRMLERDRKLAEIQGELELARRIQFSILPQEFPDSKSFNVAARYVPMTSVAGDLYDYLVASEDRAGLLIADVSGHGVPAALIASMVKMAGTSQKANSSHPAQLLAGMNAALCGNTQGQFVTAAYVYLDAKERELRYAAAGHPAMLMLRDGTVTEVAENGLLLAAAETVTYREKSLALETGDRLLLYTDGLTEARNGRGEIFGEEALAAALLETSGLVAGEAADKIIGEVEQWAKLQDDDLTLLVCDFLGRV